MTCEKERIQIFVALKIPFKILILEMMKRWNSIFRKNSKLSFAFIYYFKDKQKILTKKKNCDKLTHSLSLSLSLLIISKIGKLVCFYIISLIKMSVKLQFFFNNQNRNIILMKIPIIEKEIKYKFNLKKCKLSVSFYVAKELNICIFISFHSIYIESYLPPSSIIQKLKFAFYLKEEIVVIYMN